MKFTIGWLKEHLDTKSTNREIIEKLTDVGLEVESFEKTSSDLDNFKVAKIINAEKHPNADKLKVCLLYTSPSPRDLSTSRMPSSA